MKVFIQEFKEFAMKGNVVDMAIGVIIGGAFGKIVGSLVNDVIMPPIGVLVGGVDFTQLKLVLKVAAEGHAEVALRYGAFLQTVVDFVIVAWAIFMAVKLMTKLRRQPAKSSGVTPPPPPAPEIVLLSEIRDLLRNK